MVGGKHYNELHSMGAKDLSYINGRDVDGRTREIALLLINKVNCGKRKFL